MKKNVKTWHLALLLLLSVLVPILTITALANQKSEETCKGHHTSQKDFYESIRLLPPLNITSVTGNRLDYVVVSEGIDLGSLDLETSYSIVPDGFTAEHHEGCFGIMYCDKHKIILTINRLRPEQCKVVKN